MNRNMKQYIGKIFTLAFILWNVNAGAQSQYDVIVNSTFSPTISDAQTKITQQAVINDTIKTTKPTIYQVMPPVYNYQFQPEPINAPKVGRDKISRLYRNYIKFGVGNYWTPYLDLAVNSLRSTRYSVGAKVYHHSSWGKIKTYAPASYSDTKIDLFGEKYFKNYMLTGDMGYSHQLVHCYGFQPDSIFGEKYEDVKIKGKDIARQYHNAYAQVAFHNTAKPSDHKFNQYYGVLYDFLTDNNKHTYEHFLNVNILMNKDIALKKSAYLNVGGKIGMDYQHNRWQNTHLNDSWVVQADPHVALKYKEYYLKLGFDLAVSIEPKSKNGVQLHLYPDVEAHLAIVPNIFSIYAKIDGGIQQQRYWQAIQENPYLSDELSLGMINRQARFYLGLQTAISRSLTIGAGVSYAMYKGLPFFMPDTNHTFTYQDTTIQLANTYTLINDSSHVLNAHFDLNYHYKDMLQLGFNFDYYHYFTSENLLCAWYKPEIVAQFDAQYTLLNKFVFKLDFYINALAYRPEFINGNMKKQAMNPFFDFDFGFEYLWSKRFSIFADLNNFACLRNRLYYDYPTHRINVLVGVKYAFGGESVTKKNN